MFCARVYFCMCVCTYIDIHLFIHIYIFRIYTYVYIHINIYICICIWIWIPVSSTCVWGTSATWRVNFSDIDDWIFHSLFFCLSPFSVYYLCRFETVCTVNKLWDGHILHLVHPKTLILDRLQHQKKDRKCANSFSDALAILNFCDLTR